MILDKVEAVNLDTTPILQCRHAQVAEDGTKYGYHRHVINPLDDVSAEPAQVQALAAAIFTPEVKAAAQAIADAEAAKAETERLEQEANAALAAQEAEAAALAETERFNAAVAAALAAQQGA